MDRTSSPCCMYIFLSQLGPDERIRVSCSSSFSFSSHFALSRFTGHHCRFCVCATNGGPHLAKMNSKDWHTPWRCKADEGERRHAAPVEFLVVNEKAHVLCEYKPTILTSSTNLKLNSSISQALKQRILRFPSHLVNQAPIDFLSSPPLKTKPPPPQCPNP